MQRCERCGRRLPEDEPSCPECGTLPFVVEPARRGALRAIDGRGGDLNAPLTPTGELPSAGRADRGARALRAVPPGSSEAEEKVLRGVLPIGGSTAAAAEIEPKVQPFVDERTGSQRRPSGAWAKGGGEGAKVLALRPEPEHDAPRTASGVDLPTRVALAAAANHAVDAAAPHDAVRSAIRSTPILPQPTGASGEYRRPPVLASESLRADIAPNDPWRGFIRIAAIALGSLASPAIIGITGVSISSVAVAAGLALIALLGVVPLDYRQRAFGLLAVAVPGVFASSLLAASHGGAPDGTLLAFAVSGLAGALFFRAEYRASRLARALVAAGVVACAAWLAVSGALLSLATIDMTWESWLPTLLGAALAPLLALSLLGFMTQNSTGGCSAWATALLVWLALYEGAAHAVAIFPASGSALTGDWKVGVVMGAIATPVFAGIAAMAMAQLLVVAAGGGREAVKCDLPSSPAVP